MIASPSQQRDDAFTLAESMEFAIDTLYKFRGGVTTSGQVISRSDKPAKKKRLDNGPKSCGYVVTGIAPGDNGTRVKRVMKPLNDMGAAIAGAKMAAKFGWRKVIVRDSEKTILWASVDPIVIGKPI